MKKRSILISFVLAYFFVGDFNLHAQDKIFQELEEIAIVDQKIMMPMRDGIRLQQTYTVLKRIQKCLLFFHAHLIISILGEMENKEQEPHKKL